MTKKLLISSYDVINDIFVGKVDGKNGYCADFGISDGIFIAIDENNLPSSVFVNNASRIFNVPKKVLESPNIEIDIDCDSLCLSFNMSVEGLRIFSTKCENRYGIPNLNFSLGSNY